MDERRKLKVLLELNPYLCEVVSGLHELGMPDAYVAGGCLAQAAWNALYGYPVEYGIEDIDVVYFDIFSLSPQDERDFEDRLMQRFPDVPYRFDVKNEARVHLWYPEKFGYSIPPYANTKDAIASFPTTASAVGARKVDGHYDFFTPYGLDDLLQGRVRPNRKRINKEIYYGKADKWHQKWPQLTVFPWHDANAPE